MIKVCILTVIFMVDLISESNIQAQVLNNLKTANSNSGSNVSLDKLPVYFRKNIGQWDAPILYQGSSPGWNANVYFMKDRLSFCTSREKGEIASDHEKEGRDEERESLVWNLHFKNINPQVRVTAEGESDSHANYFIGNDESRHKRNVPDYRMIRYKDIYDHININYYSTGKNLKYDYILNPGADINKIQGAFEGIKKLRMNSKGDMEIETLWGTVVENLPESYQLVEGQKRKVDVEYKLINDTTFGLRVKGYYNIDLPLVIDPVTLKWCTYVSGNLSTCNAYIYDIAVDAVGDIYGAGISDGNYPITAGVYDNSFNGVLDVEVIKLNSSGTSLLWSTYVGGSDDEHGEGIAINAAGDVFVAGYTKSVNFPAVNAYDNSYNGVGGTSTCTAYTSGDAFVFKLSGNGSNLTYSTFIGGALNDYASDIVINSADEVYITGGTESSGFPVTAGALYSVFTGVIDAFFCKFNSSGNSLIYSTFLGGSQCDIGLGLTLDNTGGIYITGVTTSANFPITVGAYDNTYNGVRDVFVTKITAAFALAYSTYVGGSDDEGPAWFLPWSMGQNKIAVNTLGQAFISGATSSLNFPTVSAYDNTFNGGRDAFVFKLNSSGSSLLYSTYIGGSNIDTGCDISIYASGEAYIVGGTDSPDFPTTTCAYDPSYNGGGTYGDMFFLKLDAAGKKLMYSTFFGGKDNQEYWPTLKLSNPTGCMPDVVMCVTSHSGDIPTTPGVYKPLPLPGSSCGTNCTYRGDQPVLFKFSSAGNIKPGFTFSSTSVCSNIPVTFIDTTTIMNQCSFLDTVKFGRWDFGDGTSSTVKNPTHTYTSPGTYNVKLVLNCPKDSVTKTITVAGSGCVCPNSPFLPSSSITNSTCFGGANGSATVSVLSGTGTPSYNYSWSTLPVQTTATATGLSAGSYTVTVKDANGCSSTRTAVIGQPGAIVLTTTSTATTCNGSNGSATASASGGTSIFGSYTYYWSTGATYPGAGNTLPAGTYTVTVKDDNGCTRTATATVAPSTGPAATFTQSPAGTVCVGTPVTFTNTGSTGTYNWVISPTNVSGTTVNFSYTFLSAGTYTVSHTVSSGGCSKQVVSTLNVISCTGGPTVTATGNSVCPGNCSAVTSNGIGGVSPYTYSWSNGGTTQNINPCPASTTTYIVTIKDAAGSTSTSAAVVTVNPAVTAVVTATNISCNGSSDGSVTASGGGGTTPYTYNWSTGVSGSGPQVSGLTTGNYTVTFTDSKGCSGSTSVVILSPAPLIGQFTKGTANCVGCGCKQWLLVSATGGISPYTYTWPDGYVNRYKNQLCPGGYTINIKDKNGCSVNVSLTAP